MIAIESRLDSQPEAQIKPGDIQFIVKRLNEKLSRPYKTGSGSYEFKFNLGAVGQDPHYLQPVDMLKVAQKKLSNAQADKHS
jgi:hypothetical protein